MANSSMDRKFKHNSLYKGCGLTVGEFLELAAENSSFWIETASKFKGERLLYDDVETCTLLKYYDGRYGIELNQEEANYFGERRKFWKEWHEEFSENNFKGIYDRSYIELENSKKREVPEYSRAISKVNGK